ncbi:MAG: ArsR/SmtB family transcription factor [Opitutales bacterium]
MTEEQQQTLARQLWALGDHVRLRILERLPDTPDCETRTNVSGLAEDLGLSQPTISHHLRVLRQAGLVTHEKMCRDCYYWIDRENAAEMLQALESLVNREGAPQTAAAENAPI